MALLCQFHAKDTQNYSRKRSGEYSKSSETSGCASSDRPLPRFPFMLCFVTNNFKFVSHFLLTNLLLTNSPPSPIWINFWGALLLSHIVGSSWKFGVARNRRQTGRSSSDFFLSWLCSCSFDFAIPIDRSHREMGIITFQNKVKKYHKKNASDIVRNIYEDIPYRAS